MGVSNSSETPVGTPPGGEPDPTGATDLLLVKEVLRRTPGAVREMGERLRNVTRLVGVANRQLPRPLPPNDLADVAQNVIVLIWEKLETFEGRSTLDGWAWRFASFELKNRVRHIAAQRVRDGVPLSAIEVEPAAPASDPMQFDPEEVEVALRAIPQEMAEVVRLKHHEGLMFKEIAERLRIPINTSKTRYYRGIERLRDALEGMDRPPEESPAPR